MSIKYEVWEEIAQEVWLKYELEIFNRLKAGEKIHGNRFSHIRREMDRHGCPMAYADKFVENELYDMRCQIEEQAVTA